MEEEVVEEEEVGEEEGQAAGVRAKRQRTMKAGAPKKTVGNKAQHRY